MYDCVVWCMDEECELEIDLVFGGWDCVCGEFEWFGVGVGDVVLDYGVIFGFDCVDDFMVDVGKCLD